MKHKIIPALTFILGAIIFGGLGVYAASEVLASQIKYNNTTVDVVLDDIYSKINANNVCVFISNQYGEEGQVGAKYACNPGDGNLYTFYLLTKSGNQVKLILEKNITDTVGSNKTLTWSNAMAFFNSGNAGYATKQAWNRVINVDLPSAHDIADASLVINTKENWTFNAATSSWFCLGSHEQDQPSGPLYCPSSTAQQKASWLFGYTRGCSSRGCANEYSDSNGYPYGYWTADLATNSSVAWIVNRNGHLGLDASTNSEGYGVRPVITVSASQI